MSKWRDWKKEGIKRVIKYTLYRSSSAKKKTKSNKPYVFKTRFSSLLTQTSDLFALTLIYMYVCWKWWATPGKHLIFRWRVGTSPWPVCCQYYFRWRLEVEFPPVELLRVCNILPFTMLHIINFALGKVFTYSCDVRMKLFYSPLNQCIEIAEPFFDSLIRSENWLKMQQCGKPLVTKLVLKFKLTPSSC